jgi:hypothetical protein
VYTVCYCSYYCIVLHIKKNYFAFLYFKEVNSYFVFNFLFRASAWPYTGWYLFIVSYLVGISSLVGCCFLYLWLIGFVMFFFLFAWRLFLLVVDLFVYDFNLFDYYAYISILSVSSIKKHISHASHKSRSGRRKIYRTLRGKQSSVSPLCRLRMEGFSWKFVSTIRQTLRKNISSFVAKEQ